MIGSSIIAAAGLLAAFHCQAEAPMNLVGNNTKPALDAIGLPPEAAKRSFDVSITEVDGLPMPRVAVSWPGDYMHLADNTAPAFQTAEGSYAFTGFSIGSCLFTDKSCITQFSIVDRGEGNGTADLLIVPAALATDVVTKKRGLMTVVMRGQCQRTDLKP